MPAHHDVTTLEMHECGGGAGSDKSVSKNRAVRRKRRSQGGMRLSGVEETNGQRRSLRS